MTTITDDLRRVQEALNEIRISDECHEAWYKQIAAEVLSLLPSLIERVKALEGKQQQ